MQKNNKYLLIIIILIILIIIPPLFRIVFKKNSSSIENNNILICKLTTNQDYTVSYETTYKNSKVQKIKIKFAFNYTNGAEDNSSKAYSQISYFTALKESSYEYINNDIIITLNQKVKQENKNDKNINNMYKSYDKAKSYYQKLGYTCK